MDASFFVVPIAVALLLGAMSPGPSFIVVAQTAISSSRTRGVLAALGMGFGGMVFALAALLGLHILLTTVPALHLTLKVGGGCYLLYLAYKLWTGASRPLAVDGVGPVSRHGTPLRALLLGLGTQLSNPKTAIVYASVFSAAMPEEPSLIASSMLVPIVFAIEFGWYTLVAVAFSTGQARAAYGRSKLWIDRLAAGAMAVLGIKILTSTRSF